MAELGYFLSSEEHRPRALVEQARLAEQAGMRKVLISDHFHPWLEEQGESPFVWAVIGGIAATTGLHVTTAVTCPTVRTHPVVVAQAAATVSSMLDGRFRLGVGTGEALNEHVLGDRWPGTDERLSMLAEAVEVMRELWQGEQVTRTGRHYRVDRARIYTTPPAPIEVPVSAFGPKAVDSVAPYADGFVSTSPAAELIQRYRERGGKGPAIACARVCWHESEAEASKLAHSLWRNSGVPGELTQELSVPTHFEQASELVTEEALKEKFACGPDPERHVALLREYVDAGFDEIHISQIGDDQAGFLDFFRREVEPRL